MAALVTSGNVTTARTVLHALAQVDGARPPVTGSNGKAGDPQTRRAIRRVLDQLTAWNTELTTDLSLTATVTSDDQV